MKVNLFNNEAYLINAIAQANAARDLLENSADKLVQTGCTDQAEQMGLVLDYLEQQLRDIVRAVSV